MLNTGWWCSKPISEAKWSLWSVPIGLHMLNYTWRLICLSLHRTTNLTPPLYKMTTMLRPPCYHHLLVTRSPGCHFASSHRWKIGLVSIYWETTFLPVDVQIYLLQDHLPHCLLWWRALTYSIVSFMWLLPHNPPSHLVVEPPRFLLMQGVTTHVSDP